MALASQEGVSTDTYATTTISDKFSSLKLWCHLVNVPVEGCKLSIKLGEHFVKIKFTRVAMPIADCNRQSECILACAICIM